jgi:serine/threonine protein kinase/WD40 repeat protein
MTVTEPFLVNLARSRLLPAEKLSELRESSGQLAPEQIAKQLVEKSLLTNWQAKTLLGGHTAFFLGKYELLDELGRGGMGAVFKARQAPIGRIVALKIMAEKLVSSDDAVARFQREIRAAAALNHPHVVSAFDAESVGDSHFLVMEYVAGESLADVLHGGRKLPVAMACEYIRQAALGLAHAHEQGMVHRDIKPNNLLVARDADGKPQIKILDLGLARYSSAGVDDAELTATGQVMGTPDYMSPEQGRNSRSADIRSDIYSLGCTLFRALTGRVPFAGESAVEKLMARFLEEAPRLEGSLVEAPAGLSEIVAKMLARDPTTRYQTPQEVVQALEPFAAGERAAATVMLPATDRGGRLAVTGSALVERLADLNVSNFLRALAHEAEIDAPSETDTHSEATLHEDRREHKPARPPIPGSLRGRVAERSRADRRGRQWAIVGTVIALVVAAAVWGWELTGRTRLVVEWPAEERQGGEFEVDGATLALPKQGNVPAVAGSAGSRKLRLMRSGYEPIETVVELARGETKTYVPEWQPTAATARRRKLDAWRDAAQAWIKQAGGRLPSADDPGLVSLRRQFAELRPEFLYTSSQRRMEEVWRRLPSPLDLLPPPKGATESPALDPVLAPTAPSEFVAGFGDSRFKNPRDINVIITSPDGSLAAVSSSGHVLDVWDLSTGRLRITPAAKEYFGGYLAFSPNSTRMVWLSYNLLVWSIRDNALDFTLPIDAAHVGGLFWTQRTNLIAVADSKSAEIHLFDAATGKPTGKLEGISGQGPFGTLVGSPDGRWLAGADAAGHTRIWNIESREGYDMPRGPELRTFLAFSPDSRQLARGNVLTPIAFWDMEQKQILKNGFDLPDTTASLTWNLDGNIRAVLQNPVEAGVWNVSEDRRQVAVSTRSQPHVRGALTGDGKRLVTSGVGGEIQVWDAETGEELLPLPPAYTAMAIDPLGEWIALGTNARTIEIRDLPGGALRSTLPVRRPLEAIAVSPDRRILAVVPRFENHSAAPIVIFDLKEHRELKTFADLVQSRPPVFTSDGNLLIAVDWTHIVAWNTSDWQLKFKRELPVPPSGYSWAHLAVTSDNQNVVVTAWDDSRGGIVGYSLPEGRQRFVDSFGPAMSVTATENPHAVVVGAGTHARWVDAKTGKSARSVQVISDIYSYCRSLAASPDGSIFIGASNDGHLAVLATDLLRPERYLSLGSDQLAIPRVLFAPDGRHVVTLNANGTVYILRLESWPPAEKSE